MSLIEGIINGIISNVATDLTKWIASKSSNTAVVRRIREKLNPEQLHPLTRALLAETLKDSFQGFQDIDIKAWEPIFKHDENRMQFIRWILESSEGVIPKLGEWSLENAPNEDQLRGLLLRLHKTIQRKKIKFFSPEFFNVFELLSRQDGNIQIILEKLDEFEIAMRKQNIHLPLLPLFPSHLDTLQPSIWLQPHRKFIKLCHRNTEIRLLNEFADALGVFRWKLIIGEAGIGKTRLALEFTQQLLSKGWYAGFLNENRLEAFIRSPEFFTWRPMVRTFVVVDYAATKTSNFKILLQRLAEIELEYLDIDRGNSNHLNIRVLLIERNGAEDRGWLNELLCCGEGQVGDLIKNRCYHGITEIQPPLAESVNGKHLPHSTATEAIINATFDSWTSITGHPHPPRPNFSAEDWQRIQINTGNRPLYLQMAAIHACETRSVDSMPLWGRGKLLSTAIDRELKYVMRECRGDHELYVAVCHIAAILCIAGLGLSHDRRWLSIVKSELSNLGIDRAVITVERKRKLIFKEPTFTDMETETGLIQPDIISEGFSAIILQQLENELGLSSIQTLRQIIDWVGLKGWANLMRMTQDLYGIEEFKGINQWLFEIISVRCVEELMELVSLIPERTTTLHDFGIQVIEQLLQNHDKISGLTLAKLLVKLGIHRTRGNNHRGDELQKALLELERAITILADLNNSKERQYWLAKAYWEIHCVLSNFYRINGTGELLKRTMQANVLGALAAINLYPKNSSDLEPDETIIRTVINFSWPEDPQTACEYANCLSNLSFYLKIQGNQDLALDVSLRAVEVGQWLTDKNWNRFAPDLARYLNNLSYIQRDQGRTKEAMKNVERSAQIREEFCNENPDQYAEALAKSLESLVQLQYAAKNIDAAQLASKRLLNIYFELVARNPEKFRAGLAQIYHNIGYFCDDGRQFDIGLEYTLKGLAIREDLAKQDLAAVRLDLAWSHHNAGSFHLDLGRPEKAIPHIRKAYELRRQAVDANPGTFINEMTVNAKKLAKIFADAGQITESVHWWDIVERCMIEDPNSDLTQLGLFKSEYAEFLWSQGQPRQAIQSAELSRRHFREVVERISSQNEPVKFAGAVCDLCYPTLRIGDCSQNIDMLSEAEQIAQYALGLIKPDTKEAHFTWGALTHNLGYALFRWGELESDPRKISRGINFLEKAYAHQVRYDLLEASKETAELLDRARKAESG